MVFELALGTNRKDTTPRQVRWEWNEIVSRLQIAEKCEHTMVGYKSMTKAQRVEVKDVGYFIGGAVDKAKQRRVLYRALLVLDIDEVKDDTLDRLKRWLRDKTYIIHSTHSSTPDAPRYRVIAPLHRVVQADEYGAIMRALHDKFDLPIDTSTFDFNRIMFLPSVPNDAEYFFESKEADYINVDEILDTLDDWKDLSEVFVPKIRVQDPKFKGGLVGAFCAKITIQEALDTYLTDIWTKEATGRYTLTGASTVGGGIIYEGKYFYSNHSTDQFLGRCHNAYDAVRLYKFGDGKKGEAEMASLCDTLGIKAGSNKAHNRTLEEIGTSDEEAKTILQELLQVDKNDNLVKSLRNAEAILNYDPDVRGVFGYDLFSEMPVLKRIPYWRTNVDVRTPSEDCKNVQSYEGMEDVDESYLRMHFEAKYDLSQLGQSLTDALNITAHKNSFHPVRDYLNSLQWDGEPRLERIFIDCFGVRDTLYAREVGKKFFVGAVRRVFIPASKMDYIPVLVSEEGLGKSKFIKRMAKLWGSDTFYTFNGSKEAYEQLRGVWIMEIPELNGVQNRSTNSRKAFVTKGEDRYRSAYLKYTKTYKRQTVFIASSNDVVFLDDPSEDGRRWWGMLCDPAKVTISVHDDSFLELVDHYWAEAVEYYLQGVLPMLSPSAEAEARMLRKVHKAENLEEGALIDYLNMKVPEEWRKMTVIERRRYWEHERDLWRGEPRDAVCTTEVAREFFGFEKKDTMNPAQGRKIGEAIRSTGLFISDGSKQHFGDYGSAVAWIRKSTLAKEATKIIKEKKKK